MNKLSVLQHERINTIPSQPFLPSFLCTVVGDLDDSTASDLKFITCTPLSPAVMIVVRLFRKQTPSRSL